MLKNILIAAALFASNSAFATAIPFTFSGLIDAEPAANYNGSNYAFYDIDTSLLSPNSFFDLIGSAAAVNGSSTIITNGKTLHDVALFSGSTKITTFLASETNGTFNFEALNLFAGNTYQLRFNINSGSYGGTKKNPTLESTINGSLSISPITVTTPVPEPETYGIMFAGLALMGTIAARRQRKN